MKLSKNTKCATVVAALAMAATTGIGAVVSNTTNVDAATVAHTTRNASLYKADGKIITNRGLAANTDWAVGKVATINGETMYQVSTNEYLRAKDSSLSGQSNQAQPTKLVGTAKSQLALYRDDTNSMSNRALSKGSAWQVGKLVVNKLGQEFAQVSTHEYADATLLQFNMAKPSPTYIADFGMAKTSTDNNQNNNNSGSTDTNTSTNTGSTTTDNNNSGSTTTNPSTGTDTNTGSTTGSSTQTNVASIKSAFITSINAERASKGLSQLPIDPTVQKMADIRAGEAIQTNSHYRPNGTKWYTLLPELGISYTTGGENLILEFANMSPEDMANDAMSSFRSETFANNHYDNLMNPALTKMGVAVQFDPSTNNYQIVEEFIG